MLKKYKVFLASSGELAQERKEITLMISRQNNKWTEQDIYLELVVWEDLLHSFHRDRIQDYFNEKMLKCDIVIALFYRKVGQFTEEEFRLAYKKLKEGKNPNFLFVFFKSGKIEIEEVNEDILKIGQLKKEIQQYQQIYRTFTSTEDLIMQLQRQLELAILHQQVETAKQDETARQEKAKQDLENYKHHLEQKFKYLDFAGLKAILLKPLPLENIYIKLRAREALPHERLRNIEDIKKFSPMDARLIGKDIEKILEIYSEPGTEKKTRKKDKDFVNLFKRLHKQKQRKRLPLRMLILGQPGSGKTTLMKWIALQCLKTGNDPFFSQFIPVFISLKDLGKDPDHTFRKKNIVNLTVQILEQENISTESFLDDNLKANRLFFLLDGLDEIGDEKVRREAIAWIQKQYIYENSLIVTSRFSGLHRASGLEFRDDIPVFAIQDFDMEDVDSFLQNWYRDVEIAITGEQRIQKAVEQGEKRHKDLMNIIKDHGKLKELAVNPLLLTIIAIVHRTRAVLPRERHKLYEECLKVMIELWNLANRKLDISFSYDNSMAHLANIAVLLMESERREMDKKEIEECCLPREIEGQTRDTFLKEMVVKAGLLYESEGKYGFLHLTFQEFLAAWYYAHSKNQNEILKHHDNDYWQETFKLFVNIGNSELFFEEVIDYLIEKNYWEQMNLWEDCLQEIVVENRKESIELRFAKKVSAVLAGIKYTRTKEDENEALIRALYTHYPLYKHKGQLKAEGWELFCNAPHPFVQSIGTSILFTADEKTREELTVQIKNRFDAFEKQKNEKDSLLLDFFLGNNNGLILLLAGTGKITDFNFALAKLKSGKTFIQFLDLRYLRDLRDLRDLLNLPDLPDLLDLLDLLDLRDLRDLRDLLNLLDLLDLLDLRNMRDMRGLRVITYYKEILAKYNKKYKAILTEHRREILDWTDRAIEKLHSLTDEEIKKYFPNTSKEELKAFRDEKGTPPQDELS